MSNLWVVETLEQSEASVGTIVIGRTSGGIKIVCLLVCAVEMGQQIVLAHGNVNQALFQSTAVSVVHAILGRERGSYGAVKPLSGARMYSFSSVKGDESWWRRTILHLDVLVQ